jgi:hypothetical protein
MSTDSLSAVLHDEQQIASLLIRWGHARDSDDWETLAACFHPEATIHISWMSGSAREFVESSRRKAAARKPGTHQKHVISGPWILVNRERAFSRSHADLHIRSELDGQEFDFQSWIRFFDLLEKRDHVWRILRRTAVYEKDRMEPVDPRGVPKDFFPDIDLSAYPASAKFLCYWLKRSGGLPSPAIISVYSDAERRLRQECEAWLA